MLFAQNHITEEKARKTLTNPGFPLALWDNLSIGIHMLWRRYCSKILRVSVPRAQRAIRLSNLAEAENSGKCNLLSKLKFVNNAIFYFPFPLGRTIRGVNFNTLNGDAFVVALSEQIKDNFNTELLAHRLATVYRSEMRFTISDKLPFLSHCELGRLPLWSMAYPWERDSPFSKLYEYPDNVLRNRLSYLKGDTDLKSDILDPSIFGRSHAVQFSDLCQSVLANGFQLNKPLPCVYILRSDREWRWVMSGSGNHRAYILNFLGFETLPAQVVGVFDRAKVSSFPLVRNGIYSKDQAIKVFDLVFSGRNILRGVM